MHFTHQSLITVSKNRQRREFAEAEIQELVASIQESCHGLLHAPVLRMEGTTLVLVAGERRLRAMAQIYELGGTFTYNGMPVPPDQIPYTNLGELSEVDAWEAELEENIRRADLTWQERAAATSQLELLRSAQASFTGSPAPTVADIAKEVRGSSIGEAQESTRKELIVSKYLDDPDVKKAPTLKEAFKVLKKKEEVRKNIEMAEKVGQSFTSKAHSLVNRESREYLQTLPAGGFDVILTDPPYGMGADSFGDSGQGVGAAAHFYKDDYDTWALLMDWFCPETFRLTKPQAQLYAFCDLDRFSEFRTRLTSAGWNVFRTPLVWHNPDGFRAPWPDKGPQRKYELVIFAVKGDRTTNVLQGDVLTYKKDPTLGHPAQKPVPLLVDLLKRVARPGDQVLDPFAGSGSTLEACHELKLTCTAVEQDPAAYGIAVKRLKSLSVEEGLF